MENQISPMGIVMLIVYAVVLCVPVAAILKRVGFSAWWSILALIPLVNLVALWIFAFSDWPRLSRKAS